MLPKSADIVIVGGGIIGCATAFYLAKAGVTPLLLEILDRQEAVAAEPLLSNAG
jgi:glycine/D-amino acid oxidase-like deaminating enzyme